jgi:hypothetical protein
MRHPAHILRRLVAVPTLALTMWLVVPSASAETGDFKIKPTSGPVGTTIEFKGSCGFDTTQVTPVLGYLYPNGDVFALVFPGPTTIASNPQGRFKVDLTIPPFGNATDPPTQIVPGSYGVWVVCGWPPPDVVVLSPQPFEVTSFQQLCLDSNLPSYTDALLVAPIDTYRDATQYLSEDGSCSGQVITPNGFTIVEAANQQVADQKCATIEGAGSYASGNMRTDFGFATAAPDWWVCANV